LIRQRSNQLTRQRFRRDVHQRADEKSRARQPLFRRLIRVGRNAEIEQFHKVRCRIVHHVIRLEIAVDDTDGVRGLNRVGDLPDDRADLFDRQRSLSLRVFLEDLSRSPLDRQEVHAWTCFTDLDRAHDVRMSHPLTVTRFAQKARDCGAVLPQFLAQYLDRDSSVIGVRCTEYGGGSAFTDFALERVAGDRLSYEAFAWHAANLIRMTTRGKQVRLSETSCRPSMRCTPDSTPMIMISGLGSP